MENPAYKRSKINSKDIKRNSKNLPKLEMRDKVSGNSKAHVIWSPDNRIIERGGRGAQLKTFKTQSTQGPRDLKRHSEFCSEISTFKDEVVKKTLRKNSLKFESINENSVGKNEKKRTITPIISAYKKS